MKLYIVDWGEECNGARYAFIRASDPTDLYYGLDDVGDPIDVRYALWNGPLYVPFDLVQSTEWDGLEVRWGSTHWIDRTDDDWDLATVLTDGEFASTKLRWQTFSERPTR